MRSYRPNMILAWGLAVVAGSTTVKAGDESLAGLVASLASVRQVVPVGEPILVDCLLANTGQTPLTLKVAGTTAAEQTEPQAGLPIEHVFSGSGFRGLGIVGESNQPLGEKVTRPTDAAPVITLQPGAIIGRRVDLASLYPAMRQTGVYHVQWLPYEGRASSNRLRLEVAQLQQVVLQTDLGRMLIRFHYEKAPAHVRNFLELARDGFYDGKTIHRVVSGTLIQGGCPRGDGSGVRPDGTTVKAEFNDLPHEFGTVSMARKEDDADSASCQFFVCLMRIPEFDGNYTIFGEVVGEESWDTLRRFNTVQTDPFDRPYKSIKIQSALAEPVPTGVRPLDADRGPVVAGPGP